MFMLRVNEEKAYTSPKWAHAGLIEFWANKNLDAKFNLHFIYKLSISIVYLARLYCWFMILISCSSISNLLHLILTYSRMYSICYDLCVT